MKHPTAVSAALAVSVALAGCAQSTQVSSLADLPHVHNVVIVDDSVFVGSHEGLYAFVDDDRFVRVSPDFDVMGLAVADDRLFASGHPGPGFDYPDPLGLLASTDGGATWASVSLTGDVDFHRLSVSGDTVVGAAANYQMIVVSDDGGATWGSLDHSGVWDFALHPSEPATMVVATDEGLAVTSDLGRSFQAVEGPPGVVVVHWSDAGLTVADQQSVFISDGLAGPFSPLADSFGDIVDIARSGDTIAVVHGHTLSVSRDGGATFIHR